MVGSLGSLKMRSEITAYPQDDLTLRVRLPGALPSPKLEVQRTLARRLPRLAHLRHADGL